MELMQLMVRKFAANVQVLPCLYEDQGTLWKDADETIVRKLEAAWSKRHGRKSDSVFAKVHIIKYLTTQRGAGGI